MRKSLSGEDEEFLSNLAATKDIIATWPVWQQRTPSTCMIHRIPSREQIAAMHFDEEVAISRWRYEELLDKEVRLSYLEKA